MTCCAVVTVLNCSPFSRLHNELFWKYELYENTYTYSLQIKIITNKNFNPSHHLIESHEIIILFLTMYRYVF